MSGNGANGTAPLSGPQAGKLSRAAGLFCWLRGATAWDVVRIVLGVLLITAALLRAHQLLTEPDLRTAMSPSRPLLIGVAEFQLLLGLWLAVGLWPRSAWQLAIVCFAAFSGFSVSQAIAGKTRCGCFGRLPVSPWVSLAVDTAALAALCVIRPQRKQASESNVLRRSRKMGDIFWPALGGIALSGLIAIAPLRGGPIYDWLMRRAGYVIVPDRFVEVVRVERGTDDAVVTVRLRNITHRSVTIVGMEHGCGRLVADCIPFKVPAQSARTIQLRIGRPCVPSGSPLIYRAVFFVDVPSPRLRITVRVMGGAAPEGGRRRRVSERSNWTGLVR